MADSNTLYVEVVADTKQLKNGLAQAEKGIKGFSNETNRAVATTNKMGAAVKTNAVPALTSFSQVIQDAPYGIRGVANNITQLTSQFGYLSKSAGGTKAALKAMLGSLTGPAGILFAVSAVTSLLVTYGDELANIGSETLKTIEKQKKFIESLEDTESVLDAQIGALDSQLKLIKLQGGSTKDLLDDKLKILETELSTLVVKKQELKNQIATTKSLVNELGLRTKIANAILIATGNFDKLTFVNEKAVKSTSELEAAFADTEKAIFDTILSIGKIKAPSIYDPKKDKSKEDAEEVTEEVKQVFIKFNTSLAPIITQANDIIRGLKPSLIVSEEASRTKAALIKFNEDVAKLAQTGTFNAFSNFGLAIGEAMATGGNVLKAAGASIISSLGDILIQFGKLTLAAGIASTALGQALKNPWNPGSGAAAIAAGAALIAIGGAVKAFSSNLGGDTDTSTDYSSSSSNYSTSTGFSSTSSGGRVVFEIAGTKLLGVLQNTQARNKAFGGSTIIG